MRELKIDPELRDLLPPLTNEEYKQLEKNIIENGFDKNFPIMEWHGFIVDGHNRYSICKKHGIDYVVVNDPAGKSNESVTRRYKLSEFESAWQTQLIPYSKNSSS